jgi:glucosamine-6-phosphate deaminase
MKLIITKSYDESAELCAHQIADVVMRKKDAMLGLATGTTPIPVYRHMVRIHKEGGADFSEIKSVNLDEYVGLDGEDPNSYLFFMRQHLFDPLGIPLSNIEIPCGMANIQNEIRRMNAFMDKNQIDVQLLSVGTNGHIGFNEPADVFHDKYYCVTLTEKTRRDNARLFRSLDEVPKKAITMGIGGIMRSKSIVFLATGTAKLPAMKAILEDGDVTPKNPGTILKFHQNCTIYLDREIANDIKPSTNVEIGYSDRY